MTNECFWLLCLGLLVSSVSNSFLFTCLFIHYYSLLWFLLLFSFFLFCSLFFFFPIVTVSVWLRVRSLATFRLFFVCFSMMSNSYDHSHVESVDSSLELLSYFARHRNDVRVRAMNRTPTRTYSSASINTRYAGYAGYVYLFPLSLLLLSLLSLLSLLLSMSMSMSTVECALVTESGLLSTAELLPLASPVATRSFYLSTNTGTHIAYSIIHQHYTHHTQVTNTHKSCISLC